MLNKAIIPHFQLPKRTGSCDHHKQAVYIPKKVTVGVGLLLEQGPGDEVAEYDIVMEVDTEELTESAYKVGKFAGSVTLLVEAQVQKYPVPLL